jgi:outer membrane lipoprotein-sorting protein
MNKGSRIRRIVSSTPKSAALVVLMLALAMLAAPVTVPALAAQGSDAQAPDAKTIMARVYDQDTSRDLKLRATLDVTDKDGHTVRKRFDLYRLGSFGNGRTLLRFTAPPELRGVALLSINQPGVTDRQWIYTPATNRVHSVTPRERSERFAGSDFTYEDFAERPLEDFDYRLLPQEDVIENHKTYKIVATPVSADRSQYKYVYYWVAQDVPCILHEEMYDQEGREVRTMHASGLRKANGIWGARKTEMDSLLDGTKSVLTVDEIHFNTGLKDSQFTPETLQNGSSKQAEPKSGE